MKRISGTFEPMDIDDNLFDDVEELFRETIHKKASEVIQDMLDKSSINFPFMEVNVANPYRDGSGQDERLVCDLVLDTGLDLLFFKVDFAEAIDDFLDEEPEEHLDRIITIAKQFRLAADMIDERVQRIKKS